MESGGHQYTLVGFSDEVDRRPLVFNDPLPAWKVCSACGLVPNGKALLPCEHSFCKPCYEQCQRSGRVVCPLDGETCSYEEAAWINHPARSILAKQVYCWNRRNGCEVTVAAADISRHFHHECGHHSARCPKCSADVLGRDVCAHLESGCAAAREPREAAVHARTNASQEQEYLSAMRSDISDAIHQIHNALSAAMSSIKDGMRDIGGAVKIGASPGTYRHEKADERNIETKVLQDNVSQFSGQTGNVNFRLQELMQNVHARQQAFQKSFMEKHEEFRRSVTETISLRIDHCELAALIVTLKEAILRGQRDTKAGFNQLSEAIDRQCGRMREIFQTTVHCPDRQMQSSSDTAEAIRENLAKDAPEIAWAKSSSAEDRQIALALLPSIVPVVAAHTWTFEDYPSLIERARSDVFLERMMEPVYMRGYFVSVGVRFCGHRNFSFLFLLHKGNLDPYITWPFNLHIRWSLLHPQRKAKLEYSLTPSRSAYKDSFNRRTGESDNCIAACSMMFSPERLYSLDFYNDRQLRLRLSLEDPTSDDEEL